MVIYEFKGDFLHPLTRAYQNGFPAYITKEAYTDFGGPFYIAVVPGD